MHILAVDHLGADRESLSLALAQALGMTLYEARARMAGDGKGPVIVASFGEKFEADKRAEQLRAAGISALILSQNQIETDEKRTIARTFILADTELLIGTRTEDELRMAYSDITLIIRGTRIAHTSRTETEKSTRFAPGVAIISGGLKMTKSVTVTSTTSTDVREGFIHLYRPELPPVSFVESGVLYDSLGPALQPTRAANFVHLLTELKKRCPSAVFDERLLTRPGQNRLLGPLFSPEVHLDIAISVLARSLKSH